VRARSWTSEPWPPENGFGRAWPLCGDRRDRDHGVRGGDVLLLHDADDRSPRDKWRRTVVSLPRTLDSMQAPSQRFIQLPGQRPPPPAGRTARRADREESAEGAEAQREFAPTVSEKRELLDELVGHAIRSQVKGV